MKKLLFVPAACILFTGCNNKPETKHHQKQDECNMANMTMPGNSPDWIITGKVKEAIMLDSELSMRGRFMSISTTNGVVTLGGTVASQDEADKAMKVAEGVEGVKGVNNQLEDQA